MKPMKKPQLPGYHSEQEEADRLGIGLATLRRWRRIGLGPKAVRCGRRYLYSHDADAKWIAEQQAAAERTERKRTGRHGDRTAGRE
jgi:predicted site-specific integrase-resolvase